MKFLEVFTMLNNCVLIPIDRIEYISFSAKAESFDIKVVSYDDDWIESYTVQKKAQDRFEEIKKIINGK